MPAPDPIPGGDCHAEIHRRLAWYHRAYAEHMERLAEYHTRKIVEPESPEVPPAEPLELVRFRTHFTAPDPEEEERGERP